MENYIVINGEKSELTEEQLKALGIEVKENPFDAKYGENAYCIDYDFTLNQFIDWNEKDLITCCPCKDKKLVKQRAKEEHLSRLLWKFANENNAVPTEEEMRDRDFYKYYIAKYENIFKYQVYLSCFAFGLGVQLFNSKEICQRAIDEVVIPFMKGEID